MALQTILGLIKGGKRAQAALVAAAATTESSTASPPKPITVAPASTSTLKSAPAAKNFQISYQANLIDKLKEDHQAMLTIYGQIDSCTKAESWDLVPGLLKQMRSLLVDHLLTEGVKLYSYLHRSFQGDEEMNLLFHTFKKEMSGIGKAAFDFLDGYAKPGALDTADRRAVFLSEFARIGATLVNRIEREEAQLYPMYADQA